MIEKRDQGNVPGLDDMPKNPECAEYSEYQPGQQSFHRNITLSRKNALAGGIAQASQGIH
jgi:hypothetical protein